MADKKTTPQEFCLWLGGYLDAFEGSSLAPSNIEAIKTKLDGVFIHSIDPAMGPADHQQNLSEAHQGSTTLRC
jgi:hypothetical protein